MIETLTKMAPVLWQGTLDTLYMTLASTVIAYLFGVPMSLLLFCTKAGGIAENKPFNAVFGWLVNILRSIPFIILICAVAPITRAIVGSIIGNTAAIVPLAIGAAPFVARMIEQSLEEIDPGVIEAARCMGATNLQIVTKVLLVESMPGIVRGLSISTITIMGYSAMAGALGAGGLGKVGVTYGYQRFQPNVMYATVLVIVVLVCIIQTVFDFTATRLDKRNK